MIGKVLISLSVLRLTVNSTTVPLGPLINFIASSIQAGATLNFTEFFNRALDLCTSQDEEITC